MFHGVAAPARALVSGRRGVGQLRWHWDVINRPEYKSFDWSTKQQEVLTKIRVATSFDDEEAKKASQRWLYVSGAPGSGKSAIILEAAVAAARNGGDDGGYVGIGT